MKKVITIFFAVILISCNNSNSAKAETTAPSKTKAPSTESTRGGSKITVKITGGANAGTYTATSTETTCSMGLTGDKSFGNQYSVNGKSDKEFSSLQLIVDDYDAAKAGTDKFLITVEFGKLLMGTSYTIDTQSDDAKKGSGHLTIKESGNEKTVTIEGKTEDGVEISATLVCDAVMTADGVK